MDPGSMVLSGSQLAVSQDFQVISAGDDVDYEHKRLVINMANGCSNNTNLSTIQRWNNQLLTTTTIQSLPKMALIERGDCTWRRKLSSVNYLSLVYRLNIEAMMIYDNTTQPNATFELQSVNTNEQQTPLLYHTSLPPNRNITFMKDNDLFRNGSNSNNYLPVYFVTKDHGLYLKQSNTSSSATETNHSMHQVYQLTPYLSTTLLNGNSNNNNNSGENDNSSFPNILATSKGYLAYIIALVGVLLIGVILLRWWRLKRIRRQVAAASTENHNGHELHADFILQSRADRIDPLPISMVNALPIVYYSVDTISNAMCVICLDDYVENKSLIRMLPCRHGFCVLCIDPWLTQKSSFCPICKYDCLPSDQRQQRQQHEQQEQQQRESFGDHHTVDMADSVITNITMNGNRADQPTSTNRHPQSSSQH